jgi:predicted lipoprotein with Yx(FWY)xxD motif
MRTRLMAAPLVGLAVLIAACGSSGASPSAAPATQAPATQAPATQAPATEAPSEAAAATVALGDNALGRILVDGEGKTLYVFVPDNAGDSTCYDDCATAWPPLVAADAASVTAGTGLDASKITVVDRTDGTKQVKYGEYPLYYFANDAAAGDVNGQGLNEKWYVVGADGEPIKG